MELEDKKPESGIRLFILSLILGVVSVGAVIGSLNTASQIVGNLLDGLAAFSALGSFMCLIGSSSQED